MKRKNERKIETESYSENENQAVDAQTKNFLTEAEIKRFLEASRKE